MSKLTKTASEKNTTNTGRELKLPHGAQSRIAAKVGTSKCYVSTTLSLYRRGAKVRGETEIKIIRIALVEATKFKKKLDGLAL